MKYFTLPYIVLFYYKLKKGFFFTKASNTFFPMTHTLQYYCMKTLCPLSFSLPPSTSLSLSLQGAETFLRSKLVHSYSRFPTFCGTPKIHYRIQKHPPPLPILSQINTIRASPSHSLNIHFNIIILCTSSSSMCSLFLGHLTKTLYVPLLFPISVACPDSPILIILITKIVLFGDGDTCCCE